MVTKRITFNPGPLKGKTYDMPVGTIMHASQGGTYKINGTKTKWQPTKKADSSQK